MEIFAFPSRADKIIHQSVRTKRMAGKPRARRDTFRHGNLPEALVKAALDRLEAEGVESLSLRELARDD